MNKALCLELQLPVTSSSPLLFYDKVLKCLNALPFLPRIWKDEPISIPAEDDKTGALIHRQGQRSTPLTSAVSRVMENSSSVRRMRERECTAARSRSRAPSSYVRVVRGNSASRGSHWERSPSLSRGTRSTVNGPRYAWWSLAWNETERAPCTVS